MKNRIRCKYFKKIFACCALAFLLFSISAPCFATGVYPTDRNTFRPARVLLPEDGWTYDNCVAVADIVEKAYNLNYFSSGVPVAVLVDNIGHVFVLVVPGVITRGDQTPIPGVSYIGVQPPAIGTFRSQIYCSIDENVDYPIFVTISAKNSVSGVGYQMALYEMNSDNTFSFTSSIPSIDQYNQENPSQSEFGVCLPLFSSYPALKSEIIAIRYGDNDWRTPYADEYSDVDYVISEIVDWYDAQFQSTGTNNNFNYELDIPSIITAIPSAAKQIINNVFGFELFGINVAGLLSVLLIVAIVGFVIKKFLK